jgi:hypothetical protein
VFRSQDAFGAHVDPDDLHEAIVPMDACVAIPNVQHSELLNPAPQGE